MWTRRLADADASCGGKAAGLAKLIAAGLRVPDGFVLEDRAFRIASGDHLDRAISCPAIEPDAIGHTLDEIARRIETIELPADLIAEVDARVRTLGGPLAVRSSATIEDGEAGAGAGVFSSRTAVSLEELWPAVRAVWLSALTPLAATYARRRGGGISINVIVQRAVAGVPIIVYTRPPGAPDGNELWVQRDGDLVRIERDLPLLVVERAISITGVDLELVVPRPTTARGAAESLVKIAAIEGLLGTAGRRASAAFSDLDLDDAWVVQARPIVHPIVRPSSPPPPSVLAVLHDGRRWTWDVAHNPDPLSPAQVGLVERIERAGAAPWSARVCAGYLYTSSKDSPRPPRPSTIAELAARVAEIETRLKAVLVESSTLLDALDRYVAFYRIWATELGPLIAVCRGTQPALAGDRPSAVEATLFAAARGELEERTAIEMLGVLAPAWDVAVPTFAEQPGLVEQAIVRARLATPTRLPMTQNDENEIAIAAVDLAERDDFWFARAQWAVRRAILERAAGLGIEANDAFWLPLEELANAETIGPVDASRRGSGARAAAARASRWNMPIFVGDSGSSTGKPGVALRGIGSGGTVSGRVRRFESLASAIVVGRGDVVVTRAVTPALAVIVIGCAAIVSETGGPLDHGAAMARELSIPCVVSCCDAWSQLADGMIVTIVGDDVTIDRPIVR